MSVTHAQVRTVLGKVSTVDGREITDEAVKSWHRVIEHSDYVKVMQAVSLLAGETTTPMTPVMVSVRADALWADDVLTTPAPDKADRVPADKPENFDAMSAAWDDTVQFAKERRIYQDQLDRDGYLGPEIS